jgi:hypothetical protein
MRNKLMIALSAVFLMLGVSTVFTSSASAGTGNEWCMTSTNSKCINAWSGGPFVKLYTGQGGGANSDFTPSGPVSGHIILEFTGNSGWAGTCIGDAYNDPGNASVSLDSCGFSGGSGGWGTLFDSGSSGCPSGYVWYRNVHWGGTYLGPQDSNTNGSPFYLNKPGKTCFKAFPPQ